MAGQFAKPRSSSTETIDGVTLPSYQGDNINEDVFTAEAREPNPDRMVKAYHQCAQTLNILRAFSTGGNADLSRLHNWNLDFVAHSPLRAEYERMVESIADSLKFMETVVGAQ